MNPLANEMAARSILADRLRRADLARASAEARKTSRNRDPMTLRVAAGTRIEKLGRRLAGSPTQAAVDRWC